MQSTLLKYFSMKFPKKLLEGIFQTEISFFEIEENKKDRVLVINKWPKFSWLENAGLIFLLLFWLLGGVMVTIQASFKIFTIINSGSNFDFDTIFFIIWFLPWFCPAPKARRTTLTALTPEMRSDGNGCTGSANSRAMNLPGKSRRRF